IAPELQKIPTKFLKAPSLKEYAFYLEKLLRLKPHILTEREEELIALSSTALDTSHKAFSAISDADFKFGHVLDKEGVKKELTHGTYNLYIRSRDRTLRKNAFTQLLGKYGEYENSITELLAGQMQNHLFDAKARHYPSCLDAALFPKNIDTSVYHALIKAVHDNIGALH